METNCIFCQIIRGEKPAEFVYQNESVVAFKDINPHAPVHLLIVPREHIRSFNDFDETNRSLISDMMFSAKKIARDLGISESGYKLVLNAERGGGQIVFHVHLHLLSGW